MAPHFSETAPGVHTTTLTDPKTERRHNVAIIESCDAWQLFVDGELRTRDLPSFKAAVAAAQSQVAARRGSSMVRVASALVLLSVAGASTIGMAKVISPLLGTETTIAEVASNTKNTDIAPSFTRVRPPSKVTKAKGATADTKLQAPVEKVFVTVTAAPEAASPQTQPSKLNEIEAAPSEMVAPVETKTLSSDVQPIGLRPITPQIVSEAKPQALSIQNSAKVTQPPQVVIEPRPEAAPSEEPTDSDNDPATVNAALPESTPEPLPTISQAVALAPPLPTMAPLVTAPLIRSARAPIEADRLNSILADIEEESNETETSASLNQPLPTPRVTKRRAPKRHKAAKRHRRVKRSAPARHTRRIRRKPIHTARAHRLPRERRMVCFGHSCRFR